MSHIHVSVNKQSTRQNTLLHALTRSLLVLYGDVFGPLTVDTIVVSPTFIDVRYLGAFCTDEHG
jgi:hypothetical protein